MKKIPWDVLLMLIIGFGAGLVYAWRVSPRQVYNSDPVALRADFKDQFRLAIASSYAATGNLPRAQARLALLQDVNPIEALNAQAQRTIANGGSSAQADQLAVLAFVLANGGSAPATSTASVVDVLETNTATVNEDATVTPFPSPAELPIQFTGTPEFETPEVIETQSTDSQANVAPTSLATITPRPTWTPIPIQSSPFTLTSENTVCDSNLPDGLLQVFVYSSSKRQMAGVKIIITWENGEEQFFTGLKPEIGNGYADYVMSPNTAYTVQLGLGSDIATNLIAPTCQTSSGENYTGGFKLTFQQP